MTPEAYAASKARQKARYRDDPEYRAHKKAASRAWTAANKERVAERNKAWRSANPELMAAYKQRWSARQTIEQKRIQSRKSLGVLNPPGNRPVAECPVCLRTLCLVLDHNHDTGRVRGWLCRQCNSALGLIGDTTEAAHRLVAYLVVDAG